MSEKDPAERENGDPIRGRHLLLLILGSVLFLLGIPFAIGGDSYSKDILPVSQSQNAAIGIGVSVLGAAMIAYAVIEWQARSQQQRTSAATQRIVDAVGSVEANPSIQRLMQANAEQMKGYSDIAQNQARGSFVTALVVVIIGFSVLVVGVCVAALNSSSAAKYSAAFLTAAGAALSGYIGKTLLAMQQTAVSQMNLYYQHPLNHSYILATERVIDSITTEELKNVARGQIVNSVLVQLLQIRQGPGRNGLPGNGTPVSENDDQQPASRPT
ncbi:TRADD-N-associated membrane domain-containing protein [Streptomyces sp. NPDC054802]